MSPEFRGMWACPVCLTLVVVRGDLSEVRTLLLDHPMWKDGWPCVQCNSPMERMDTTSGRSLTMLATRGALTKYELTAREFFGALCGFGLPQEVGCEPEVVKALLRSTKIRDVVVVPASLGRTAIREIHLDNGLRLHLASSLAGATVFKITRAHNDGCDLVDVQPKSKTRNVQGYIGAVSEDVHSGRGSVDQHEFSEFIQSLDDAGNARADSCTASDVSVLHGNDETVTERGSNS